MARGDTPFAGRACTGIRTRALHEVVAKEPTQRPINSASVWRSGIRLVARRFLIRARHLHSCRAHDTLRPANGVGLDYWDPSPGRAREHAPPAPSLLFSPALSPSGFTARLMWHPTRWNVADGVR